MNVVKRCKFCGSDEVRKNANLEWSVIRQAWVIRDDEIKSDFVACYECEQDSYETQDLQAADVPVSVILETLAHDCDALVDFYKRCLQLLKGRFTPHPFVMASWRWLPDVSSYLGARAEDEREGQAKAEAEVKKVQDDYTDMMRGDT